MADYVLNAEPFHINLSPLLFRYTAQDCYKAYLDFKPQRSFSSVPYFLCCMAIELGLKAIHLENANQKEVKTKYGHNLLKSYRALPLSEQVLSPTELVTLEQANKVYLDNKGFEYLTAFRAATAYSDFPDLNELGLLAKKLSHYEETGFEKTQSPT